MTPDVDVIIAIHDPARPVQRAVGSVLDGTAAPIRVTVVAHDTDPTPIRSALARWTDDARLRIVELDDGVRSPAGPFNRGLDLADAPFTSVMGSDDTLEVGAIDSWLAMARRIDADVVISRLRHVGGRPVPTPPARPHRRMRLDGVKDRLSYRSAPLGLVSATTFGGLRFTPDRAVGEDVPYTTQLWFSGACIGYDRRGPAYVIHADAPVRTTTSPRPIRDELRYLLDVVDATWFQSLPTSSRAAFCVKALRVHLFGAVHNRPDPTRWTTNERVDLATFARAILAQNAGVERVLSRHERALLDIIQAPMEPAEVLLAASRRRRQFATPGALLPRRVWDAFRREAPLRMTTASALQLV